MLEILVHQRLHNARTHTVLTVIVCYLLGTDTPQY